MGVIAAPALGLHGTPAEMGQNGTEPAVSGGATPPMARIALDLPLPEPFDFLAGPLTTADLNRLVVVPFGRKNVVGVLIGFAHETDVPREKLRAVEGVIEGVPPFDAQSMAVFQFCADYYHAPIGQVILNSIPPQLRVPQAGATADSATVRQTKTRDAIGLQVVTITHAGEAAIDALPARAVAQRQMLISLREAPQLLPVLKQRHARAAVTLRTLLQKSWVTQSALDLSRSLSMSSDASNEMPIIADGPTLNTEQRAAVDAVLAVEDKFAAFLLDGVTGSGKTEVYLNVIAHQLTRGKQALVMVPEINLTPLLLRRISARFPAHRVVAAHSGMPGVARLAAWRDAQDGRADIVIGTRLAVFTPMPRLGVIIIDEEHDASFKQQDGIRYSARDVAVFRAREAACPIVLGSATPSIETLENARRERFATLTLTQRAMPDAQLPHVDFIHLDSQYAQDGLTTTMIAAIDEVVQRGEQAMVFINRRGFAPALVCGTCAWMPECTRCSARMVLHQRAKRLRCHHCGAQARVPEACPKCHGVDLFPAGQGSERIEMALQTALPNARIARVDRDATRRRGSAEKIFDAAEKGEIDVMVGTQMLAKGHDFHNVTLVCVVNADGAVFVADFRAAERMAQQLMQVAGRAGRGARAGRVLIQTRFAVHPVYEAVRTHSYKQFVDVALDERRVMQLPPYSHLTLLRGEARDVAKLDAFFDEACAWAKSIAATLADEANTLRVWEPVPSTLERKAGFTRKQLMLQSTQRSALHQLLDAWLPMLRASEHRGVKWIVDVDPIEV